MLAVWAIVGLVVGWLANPLSDRWGSPPVVTWTPAVSLAVVAAVVGGAAWATWRAVQVRRERLEPHRALNRLVLARACAYVGSIVAGGYAGYALSWLGSSAELADHRAWRSGGAAAASVVLVAAALVLERACRVREDDARG
ncbi:DUF3180 domain-containing protein [Nocardioides sp. R-C-SC26]|uniref:DUF3180 domain-containing protein n=1 Tax=Nocardioides sp. R-C-SC26 TaxID=2870414 RepID=UPI001E5B30FC|nr:DUF3180 domain-containing protein [Nocardioides sp. R-C-SC26]